MDEKEVQSWWIIIKRTSKKFNFDATCGSEEKQVRCAFPPFSVIIPAFQEITARIIYPWSLNPERIEWIYKIRK